MKKFVVDLFVISSLILLNICCQNEVSSSDEQSDCEALPPYENLWDMCKIPYYIDSSVPAKFFSKIRDGLNAWTVYTGIRFELKPQNESNIIFKFGEVTGEGGCNSSVGERYAYTSPPNRIPNPNREVVFNSNLNWDDYLSNGTSVNFQATATHEIGHVLGLRHIDNRNALMYCCDVGQTTITEIDIDAIQSILDVHCDCNASSYKNAVKWSGNGHYYEVVFTGTPINWEDANAAAIARGGGWHLATITSAAENNFIESLFIGNPSIFNCCHYPVPLGRIAYGPWLGAKSTTNSSNDWTWITGEPFAYADWGPYEPFGNGNRIAYCQFGASQQLAWNDMPSVYAMMPLAYILECSGNGK